MKQHTLTNGVMTNGIGHADSRSGDRVRRHTAGYVNEKIDTLTLAKVEATADAGRDAIILRLAELDQEWDLDRALMANFAIVGGTAFALGQKHRGWRYFFSAQMAFLLMHAVVGWCPPAVLFRRLGLRTAKEIEAERRALAERLASLPAPRGAQL